MAAAPIEAAIRRRPAIGKPSSTTKPADRRSGRAPAIARSFTVPFTASSPISPPGKKSGLTTYESVVNAELPDDGCVAQHGERRIVERRQEQPFDKAVRRLAARAVGECDRRRQRAAAQRSSAPPVVVVGGAGALARDHAGAERPLRRARRAEDLALPGLDRADEHLAALAGLRVGDALSREARSAPRRPTRRTRRGAGSRSRAIQPSPRHSKVSRSSIVSSIAASARGIAVAPDDARVLVLDLAAALAQLAQRSARRAWRMSSGSKAVTTTGRPYSSAMKSVRRGADHRRDVAGPDEGVEPQRRASRGSRAAAARS